MDGILRGRLSVSQRLSGRLSIMPRGSPGPQPILVEKTITANGVYQAMNDGADGYSQVNAVVPVPTIPPHAFDLSGGYVANGTWNIGSDTVCYSNVYAVSAGQAIIIALGDPVGSRFRAMFSEEDPSIAAENVVGRNIVNQNNPLAYSYVIFKVLADGYITITKDNAGTANLRTFCFDLAELISGASFF